MDHAQHNSLTNFIWNIADDVLRDVFTRGKYRDVILPMTVIRRLDAVLEPTRDAVLKINQMLDAAGVVNKDAALRNASGEAFYNTSTITLRQLRAEGQPQKLRANFEAYLDGFSANVREILDKFKFRNQIPTLIEADAVGGLLEKFLDPQINLSPRPAPGPDGKTLPGLHNHAMGTLFEELIRRFNEENNEEAGEHFTPRDVVTLMADLIFTPIADRIEDATYTVYDAACGTGGMLTVAEDRLRELAAKRGKEVTIHLYGQEVNPETYAITKADLLLKGEGGEAENFHLGSTLSQDAFGHRDFDFMLSNPPYGKSWKSDLERMGGKDAMTSGRFTRNYGGDPEYSLITRSSDGQLMFLVNKLLKMKEQTPLGSRIAEVHNGSSLFTGDAGQGESNIRRWVIESDYLEAIIALPLNLFYNTGIATYIWVLTNRKPAHRQGKVQLIDATARFKPLRKNLGKKNCELSGPDRQWVTDTFQAFAETPESKVFPNDQFGYWKVTLDRPLRLRAQFTHRAIEGLRFQSGDAALREQVFEEFGIALFHDFAPIANSVEAFLRGDEDGDGEADEDGARPGLGEKRIKKLLDPQTWRRDGELHLAARQIAQVAGEARWDDFNQFRDRFDQAVSQLKLKLGASERKIIQKAVSWRDEDAPPVVRVVHKPGKVEADPLRGRYADVRDGKPCIVEYEADSDLRDTEQVPLREPGGIEGFVTREVLPYVPDAWIVDGATRIGYEVSFTRYFYHPQPLRTLDAIRADIESLERETDGLLGEILVETAGEAAEAIK